MISKFALSHISHITGLIAVKQLSQSHKSTITTIAQQMGYHVVHSTTNLQPEAVGVLALFFKSISKINLLLLLN